jgi:hypothetical protein
MSSLVSFRAKILDETLKDEDILNDLKKVEFNDEDWSSVTWYVENRNQTKFRICFSILQQLCKHRWFKSISYFYHYLHKDPHFMDTICMNRIECHLFFERGYADSHHLILKLGRQYHNVVHNYNLLIWFKKLMVMLSHSFYEKTHLNEEIIAYILDQYLIIPFTFEEIKNITKSINNLKKSYKWGQGRKKNII